jgi:hypothetical protein
MPELLALPYYMHLSPIALRDAVSLLDRGPSEELRDRVVGSVGQ